MGREPYTKVTVIPETGKARFGIVGGSGIIEHEGLAAQVGFEQPVRKGVLWVNSLEEKTALIRQCRVKLFGYNNRPIEESACPTRIIVELPVSVEIEGPPGLQVVLGAWTVETVGNERGAHRSHWGQGTQPIPNWGRVVDWNPSTGATLVFRDHTNATVGQLSSTAGAVVSFTIPEGAVSAEQTGSDSLLVFRQQG